MAREAGPHLRASCKAASLSTPRPSDCQLLARVPFLPSQASALAFPSLFVNTHPSTHCFHGPAPASLLWGPSVDAAPGTPGPHLGHTWARPASLLLLKPEQVSLPECFDIRGCVFYIYGDQLTCLAESGGEVIHPIPSKSFLRVHNHVYIIPYAFSVAAVTNYHKFGDLKQTENYRLTVLEARSPK